MFYNKITKSLIGPNTQTKFEQHFQMTRIKSLIGQFWNSHSSPASDESGTSGVATANETRNEQPQETSPILRNNYLYAPLGNER